MYFLPIGVAIFILGMILGSFVNAWTFRLGTGLSIVSKRSQCFSCSTTIEWYDLIPVASFIVLRRRCRACSSPISFQYPLVELLLGILFTFTYLIFGLTIESLVIAVALVFLTALVVYDMRHTIIPDEYVYPFIGMSFLLLFISGNTVVVPALWDILIGPIFFLSFFLLWFVSKGRWMGFADAKLTLGIGWMLGLSYGITALCVAFWSGALIMLGMIGVERVFFKSKAYTLKSQIPFAPFLVLGLLIVLFTKWTIFPWL